MSENHLGHAVGNLIGEFGKLSSTLVEKLKADHLAAIAAKDAEIERILRMSSERNHGASGLCCQLREQEKQRADALKAENQALTARVEGMQNDVAFRIAAWDGADKERMDLRSQLTAAQHHIADWKAATGCQTPGDYTAAKSDHTPAGAEDSPATNTASKSTGDSAHAGESS